MNQNKDVILFVNSIHAATYSALRSYEQKTGKHFRPVVIVDAKIKKTAHALNNQDHLQGNAEVVTADFSSVSSIREALRPFEGRIAAVTSQYENSIHELKKLIPHMPYLPTPTEKSLDLATDKKLMREAFNAYDPSLSPQSMHVADATSETIDAIERAIDYPVIIKPSGLERSMLVAVARNRRELSDTLALTFRQLQKAYKTWMKRLEPTVLVEEFMEGEMYSVDTYISRRGEFRHSLAIRVITGHNVGFTDFFSYLQMSPAGLDDAELQKAYQTTENACKALGLRAITAHTELMKTPKGWKIIEVGPRIGGYRHELYSLSHGMNHIMNDVLNRADITPEIPAHDQNYAAIFKTYAREEGMLKIIHGLDEIKRLPSYVTMKQPYKQGDMLRFASNNGNAPIEITLCSPSQQQLQSDIEMIERILHIETM